MVNMRGLVIQGLVTSLVDCSVAPRLGLGNSLCALADVVATRVSIPLLSLKHVFIEHILTPLSGTVLNTFINKCLQIY